MLPVSPKMAALIIAAVIVAVVITVLLYHPGPNETCCLTGT
jgi:hypothetical protein